jgi:integrase
MLEALNEVVDERGPYAGHNLLAYASKLFNWAIARDVYGLEHSPSDRIRPTDAIGKRQVRQRVLTDAEIRIFWAAAGTAGYPFGPLVKLLLLTGQRRAEVSEMSWSEVDPGKQLWAVPPERMKADAPHLVPLSREAMSLLEALPEFKGDFVFTTSGGVRPVSGFGKAKLRLDAAMLKLMREEAAERGEDPTKVTLTPWRLHDLRRTARTHFSAIPSQDLVRELAIGHTRPELHRVYDQHLYLDEKRELFDAWGTRLMAIVTPDKALPPDSNVVKFRAGR